MKVFSGNRKEIIKDFKASYPNKMQSTSSMSQFCKDGTNSYFLKVTKYNLIVSNKVNRLIRLSFVLSFPIRAHNFKVVVFTGK